ncbi:MAG: CDP-alcohol phosphatidyltransferase family protein [Oscillospiraceae bacterium]|nr:CDP-alcohol phosphatidyltransferase family protein [Oscillospiraceae bacterium]
MKHIPNALSIARFPIALSLIAWTLLLSPDKLLGDPFKWVFSAFYLLSGMTDILDGYLARKYHWESKSGGILDGLADVTFFLVCLASLFLLYQKDCLKLSSLDILVTVITGACIIVFKTFNYFMTYARFKQFNGVHTWSFKTAGTVMYFAALAFMWLQRLDFRVAIVLGAITIYACAEELYLLFAMKEYDVDHPGLIVQHLRRMRA